MSAIGAFGQANSAAYWYQGTAAYAPNHETTLAPVEPVREVDAVHAGRRAQLAVGQSGQTGALDYNPHIPQMPELRQGADPVEMAVRGRIEYLNDEQVDALMNGEPTKSPAEVMEDAECQTCENRKYQDGSDDPGVSFKSPTNITPEQAPSMVRGHEMEHVVRERAKAEREDRTVVQQSVTLNTDICPECGTPYISGGVTQTVTKADPAEPTPAKQQEQTAPGVQ